MIVSDGYSIVYYKNKNQISIMLPHTWETLAGTSDPISNRKLDLSDTELASILLIVKAIFEETKDGMG